VERRKFISGLGSGIVTLSAAQNSLAQVSIPKSPILIRDDLNAFPAINGLNGLNVLNRCDAIRTLMTSYSKSYTALLGNAEEAAKLQASMRKAYQEQLKAQTIKLKALEIAFPKQKRLDDQAKLVDDFWQLVGEIALYGLIDVLPLVLKATPTGLLFSSAVALTSTTLFAMQIIQAPSGAQGAVQTVYNFKNTQNNYFKLLPRTADNPALGLTTSAGRIFSAVDGLLLFQRSVALGKRYLDAQTLEGEFVKARKLRQETIKTLEALMNPANQQAFLSEALRQQGATVKALQAIYLSASFSACQSLPTRGLKYYMNDTYGPYEEPLSNILP
jgi:hypothetical protein